MRRAFANRIDETAHALVKEARGYGAKVIPLNGVIDAIVLWKGGIYLVDWKGEKTPLTKKQMALVTEGFPIFFIRTSQALKDLLKVA